MEFKNSYLRIILFFSFFGFCIFVVMICKIISKTDQTIPENTGIQPSTSIEAINDNPVIPGYKRSICAWSAGQGDSIGNI